MAKTILPLYSEFAEIFKEYEINNWEAKDFWDKMNLDDHPDAKNLKKMLYACLRILVELDYLNIDQAKSKKNCFSYVQTEHLIELKKLMRTKILKQAFDKKKVELSQELTEKRRNVFFLTNLMIENHSLDKYLSETCDSLERDIQIINSNISLMETIMRQQTE